jgi:hypothetical protein
MTLEQEYRLRITAGQAPHISHAAVEGSKYGGMEASDARKLKGVEEKNGHLAGASRPQRLSDQPGRRCGNSLILISH